MNNKSRDKIGTKPPIPLKTTSTINRPPSKPAENVFPAIKPRKESLNSNSNIKPSSLSKPVSGKISSNHGSTKKIETPTGSYKKQIIKEKPKYLEKPGWDKLPLNLLLEVSEFACQLPFQVYRLSLVCSLWRQLMECQNAVYFWRHFKKCQGALTFGQFKKCLQGELLQIKQKRSVQFENLFAKLFNYGSTKENIPNKLISRLKLELTVTINKRKYPLYPFKLRSFNFSSYLYAKMPELSQIPFDMYTPHNFFKDNLEISLHFYSRTYKVAHSMVYKFKPEQVAECAIRQKAFNYFLDKNLIITFFQGDKTFLYAFLEISVLQLVTEFRKAIRACHQEHIDRKNKSLPMYKKLCETQFQDFVEYFKYQADFQLHMSYHNSVKQIFTHCDTKVYPLEYNNKSAYFEVKINDTFNKTSTFMLDNKMGMSESIDGLYLLDFVLKDRDRFIVVFSGFIYAREASQKERESVENFFQFADYPVRLLEFKADKYDFSIMIIEEPKKNFILHTRFRIYP